MEPTPTGGSAHPSVDGGEAAEAEGPRTEDDGSLRPAGERPGDALPAPWPDRPFLPRRRRGAAGPGEAGAEGMGAKGTGAAEAHPARNPDGRPYRAPDPETLDRLLTGLRDI
jgi:hypothetical protein